MDNRLQSALELTDTILNAPKFYFSALKPSQLQDGLAVVYAITNQDTGEALYVGRTKNLQRRLYTNHLMGPKSNARLKKYLVEDENEIEVQTMDDAKQYLRNHCYFQYIAEPDAGRRGQIEGLLSFMLDVKYMHEEH